MENNVEHLQVDQINGLIAAAGVDGTREIMDTFWRSTTDLLAALKGQVSGQSFADAASSAHAIKGSAANVGAVRLSETASQVEQACKSGASDEANALLARIDGDYEAAKNSFEALLANA